MGGKPLEGMNRLRTQLRSQRWSQSHSARLRNSGKTARGYDRIDQTGKQSRRCSDIH